MSDRENVPKNEADENRKIRSYSTARTFIKDFGDPAPIVTIPYCAHFSIHWNDETVDLFVKKGNEANKETERPAWLKSWPMTSKSLKKDIVSVLKNEGRPPLNVEESSSVRYVAADTSAQAERVLAMLETVEKDSFMQLVMKIVLEEPGDDQLAQIIISNEEQNPVSIGTCILPSGCVHLFNREDL